MSRKLIVFISCSIDGFIAKPGDDLSFLSIVEKDNEDYGYHQFIDSIDTIIIGRKTYDWVLNQIKTYPHPTKQTYVITKQAIPNTEGVTFYNGDIPTLIKQIKSQPGKNIYCDGGAELVNYLLRQKLVDEMIISVIPIILGNGTPLFQKDIPETIIKVLSSKKYDTGLIQTHYLVSHNG